MGATKPMDFDSELKNIAAICKALGHPTRMQIMTLLYNQNNRICGDIVAQIPLAQSTISKHLSELKKANLLQVKNEGKKTIYSIDTEKIQLLRKYFSNYLANKAISNSKEFTTQKTNPKKNNNSKAHLKQFNYQFPDKKNTTE